VRKAIENAVRWAAAPKGPEPRYGMVEPLEKLGKL
jgi:hypothetical protein